MSNSIISLLQNTSGIMTLNYLSSPELKKAVVKEHPLLQGRKITKIQRIQVNGIKHYREWKAKQLGVKPSEVEVRHRDNWTVIEDGLVQTDKGDFLFYASPMRQLNETFYLDGEKANNEETKAIEGCLRKRNYPVELRTYRLDKILSVNGEPS